MSDQLNQFFITGVIVLVTIIGIMGMVFFNYLNKLLNKVDGIPDLKNIVTKVEGLVNKVEKIHVEQNLCKQKQNIEVDSLRASIERVSREVHSLREKRI